jgi:histidyl-tRNA synthetase
MPSIQRPRGTRDFGPEDMNRRRYIENVLRTTADTFGYREIATPTFEHVELFTERSGEEVKNEMYTFKDKGGRELSLRPELTAPTMRFYATDLRHLPKPIKVYYFGNCFRYERPQSGRYREFWQFGAEIIGGDVHGSDADIIAMSISSLHNTGLTGFSTRIGHLGVLRSLLHEIGVTGQGVDECMHLIDKGELATLYDLLEGQYPNQDEVDIIRKLLEMEKTTEIDSRARDFLKENAGAIKALNDLEVILDLLSHHGIRDYIIDLGIARGLDYYTGMVFEIDVPSLGAEKQVCGGGAYELAQIFGTEAINSTGFAIGFDRIMMALGNMAVDIPKLFITAYIIPMNDMAREKALEIAAELRRNRISCDIALGTRSIAKNMKYANTMSTRFTIILGEDEMQSGMATVKHMNTGEQVTVPFHSITQHITSI